MIGKLVCGFVAVLAVVIGLNEYLIKAVCHTGIPAPHNYLATKTPYIPHPPREEDDLAYSSCQPLQLWMVVRHGTRNPSAKVIEEMKQALTPIRDQIIASHQLGKGSLCPEAVEALTNWKPTVLSPTDEKMLVSQGEAELRGIGTRFRKRFPTLVSNPYSNTTYKFKYTKTERAASSAKFFVEEILGAEEASRVKYPEPLSADPVLRFYKGCPKWKKEVDKNPNTYLERIRFETSPIFQSMINKMELRLGVEGLLSVKAVEIIYMTCAFETSWNPENHSPWCHLFDEEDLKIMQYRQDLEYYWVDGYGYELTYKQACPAVKDLLGHFREKVNDPDNTPSLIAYFTHSGTILKLLSRFGLFKDTSPLLHDNFYAHHNRLWKTSQIDKFATNLAFVLYKCPDEHRVGLFFQEQIVPIPGCGKPGLCTLADFLDQYDPLVNNCDMPQMCEI